MVVIFKYLLSFYYRIGIVIVDIILNKILNDFYVYEVYILVKIGEINN